MTTPQDDDAKPLLGDVVEDGYYVAIWFLAGEDRDWMAILSRQPGETRLTLRYRFRYYEDDKVFYDETADTKNGYSVSTDKPEDEVIADVDAIVAKLIAKGYCGTKLPWKVRDLYTRRVTKCDGRAFAEILMSLPFVHWKRADVDVPKGSGRIKKSRSGKGN